MDLLVAVALQVMTGIATLFLISLGLAVIFGMMGVINLAHGEFLMLGGYAAILSVRHGINLWVAMFLIAPLAVGLFGLIVERLMIRRLYGQMVETMLATWGLSLALIGIVTMVFGNTVGGFSAPLGSVQVGKFQFSAYSLFLIGAAGLLAVLVWIVLRRTPYGLLARGTMQNAEMAAALGVATERVYAVTFALGAALTGLAGGLLAPLSGVVPTMGTAYIAKAFITVITGGAAMLVGTLSASVLLGAAGVLGTFLTTPVLGEAALLALAIVLVRLLPRGITGRFFQRAL
ncbi:MAG: branched-chain amino acid ABC transporter permease [Acidobacteriia bacterium]|nr:branched-chain amino acid ABC transporter permease [Methyloceanibacter sp.]MBX5471102.1 branched-chain amino acid ABC transporter permease [Acetobacteraceae bacterium]MCL6491448.1 branched-chain amino acid ABC transporter permease [Terriglobia bacterium]